MKKAFKIVSYLYIPLGTSENTVNQILGDRFSNLSINSVEEREDEIAVDFDIIVEEESRESADNNFLAAMNGYDVDNYNILDFYQKNSERSILNNT